MMLSNREPFEVAVHGRPMAQVGQCVVLETIKRRALVCFAELRAARSAQLLPHPAGARTKRIPRGRFAAKDPIVTRYLLREASKIEP